VKTVGSSLFMSHEVLVSHVGMSYPEVDGGSVIFPGDVFEERPRVSCVFDLVQFVK